MEVEEARLRQQPAPLFPLFLSLCSVLVTVSHSPPFLSFSLSLHPSITASPLFLTRCVLLSVYNRGEEAGAAEPDLRHSSVPMKGTS